MLQMYRFISRFPIIAVDTAAICIFWVRVRKSGTGCFAAGQISKNVGLAAPMRGSFVECRLSGWSDNEMKNLTGAAILFSAVILSCGQATATTVSYNFDETGWVNTAGTTENFLGSFTGTPEASGILALTDLTNFSSIITETNAQGDTKTIGTFGGPTGTNGLTDFVFASTSNSLTLAATGIPGASICLGQAVAQGICGPVAPRPVSTTGVPAPPLDGIFLSSVNGTLNAYTISLPTITLVQSPVAIPVQQPSGTASTPEPASFALCGGTLLLVSMFLRRRSRS
jgi:hypothetical protein